MVFLQAGKDHAEICAFERSFWLQGGGVGGGGWVRLEERRQGGRVVGEDSEDSTGLLAIAQLQKQHTSSSERSKT